MGNENSPSAQGARRPWRRAVLTLAVIAALAGAVPALNWQRIQAAKTRCLTNQRRLSTALLLYTQDHDGRLPPPEYRRADGGWQTWVAVLQPYIAQQEILTCPANPADGARSPFSGYAYPYSYALNSRFFDRFHPGPFPLENLEFPAQTALIVEGGRYRAFGKSGDAAMPWYWDTAWQPRAYPSPHNGRMNVAAADGHVVSVQVAHYRPQGHDALYGRLGGVIYNWNGGHPNGDTAGPPRE